MRHATSSYCVLACLAVVGLATASVNGELVKYRVDYDPVVQSTTLFNDLTSEHPLMFRTRVGPRAGVEMGLVPGAAVTINADGTFAAGWGESLWDWLFGDPVNKKNGSTYTVHAFRQDVTVTLTKADGTTTTVTVEAGSTYTVPLCTKFDVKGPHRLTGCEIDATTFAQDALVYEIGPASWGGDPTQDELKFFGGTIWSTNDHTEFLTISTPQVATGCPEPAGALPLVAACGVLATRRRR